MFSEQKPYLLSTILALAAPFAASVLGTGEAAAAVPSACDAIAGNLVTNCGFETTGGWTPSFTQAGAVNAHTGSGAADLGSAVGAGNLLEQTITTVIGDTYTLTFWAGSLGLTLDVSFGTTDLGTVPFSMPGYQEFTYTVTASATSELLKFDSSSSPSSGYGSLDDVSLVLASPTPAPEPASLALFATGLAGLAGLRRRRR
jgi:hypothetical protein